MIPPDRKTITPVNSIQTSITIYSADLRIEGALHLPPDATDKVPGVVLCHPHPRYGGDMNNNVVLGLTDRLIKGPASPY